MLNIQTTDQFDMEESQGAEAYELDSMTSGNLDSGRDDRENTPEETDPLYQTLRDSGATGRNEEEISVVEVREEADDSNRDERSRDVETGGDDIERVGSDNVGGVPVRCLNYLY